MKKTVGYNGWLDIDVLEDYLDGKLDAKTMHKVEKLSLEDPFVAEALAGLSQSPKRTQTLSLLQKQLQERVAQKTIQNKRWQITSQRLSIAAAAAVLFITVSILFVMRQNSRPQITAQKDKKVDISVAPQAAKVDPNANPAVETISAEKLPAAKKHGYLSQGAKVKANVATTDGLPNSAAVAAVSDHHARTDTVKHAVAIDNTREAEQLAKLAFREKEELIAKKAETVRERPLASKVPGIYVENNSNAVPYTGIINGRVFTKTDGQPLPGAIVRVAGTNKATITNNKGEFTLPVDSSMQSLSVAYLGYTSQQVKAQANQEVKIALETVQAKLNEVMVNGDQKAKAQVQLSRVGGVASNASPVGGWGLFEDYLKANHKLYKESSILKYVTVSFEVNKAGRARNIKIVSGLGKAENEEAIRLIKDGPNWVKQTGAKTATLSIKF